MRKLLILNFSLLCLLSVSSISCRRSYSKNSPIDLWNAHDMIIRGETIKGGSVPCIKLKNCKNIRITHCNLLNSSTFGIFLYNCSNIVIDSNYISKVSAGVYVQDCPEGQIRVLNNEMLNMLGEPAHKDFVQFNHVNGANNRVCNNKLENIQGESNPEDGINMYKSNGLAEDPIYIANNQIRGGGPSVTGSGITLGDKGGSYQVAEKNTLVNTGFIGMQIAGGHDIKMINNTIYSRAFRWSHIGLGCGNYSGQDCYNITIANNKVNWIAGIAFDQHDGSTTRRFDASYQKSKLDKPTGWDTNTLNAPIDSTILPEKLLSKYLK